MRYFGPRTPHSRDNEGSSEGKLVMGVRVSVSPRLSPGGCRASFVSVEEEDTLFLQGME